MPTLSANPIPERTFLTTQEVSRLLHVSVQTVRRWIKDEKLPAYKVGPRMWRIRMADLDEWLRRSAVASSSEDTPVESMTVSTSQ
jgi:excisionase family DNA binding protein